MDEELLEETEDSDEIEEIEELEASDDTEDSEELLTEDSDEAEETDDSEEEVLDASKDEELVTDSVTVAVYPSGNCKRAGVREVFHTNLIIKFGCSHSLPFTYLLQERGWPSSPKVGIERIQLFHTVLLETGTPKESTGNGMDEAADASPTEDWRLKVPSACQSKVTS
jgi:hypothetical protein